MKREDILERIRLLKERHDQMVLEIQQIDGAIADCEFWLSYLDNQKEQEQKPEPEPSS